MHLERQIATGTASDTVSRSLCKRQAQGSRNVSVCTEEGGGESAEGRAGLSARLERGCLCTRGR